MSIVVPKKRRRLWPGRRSVANEVGVVEEVKEEVVRTENKAWECGRCRLVVCAGCKEKFCKELSVEGVICIELMA